MITKDKFEIAVYSKIVWLTKYYIRKNKTSADKAYVHIKRTGIIDIIADRNSELFLESVELIVKAIDVYYEHGKRKMKQFLKQNIG